MGNTKYVFISVYNSPHFALRVKDFATGQDLQFGHSSTKPRYRSCRQKEPNENIIMGL